MNTFKWDDKVKSDAVASSIVAMIFSVTTITPLIFGGNFSVFAMSLSATSSLIMFWLLKYPYTLILFLGLISSFLASSAGVAEFFHGVGLLVAQVPLGLGLSYLFAALFLEISNIILLFIYKEVFDRQIVKASKKDVEGADEPMYTINELFNESFN
eukprot:MONOS_5944.1-p1 / transcript=MONOS_5944.1 / gene=MONOS_5944 / organism=Monocercomonoides_exilis_PA203 / gene_product=unspecified product / transcript_product=unspecified product / location=Mono_scaffold00180:2805-3442(-) / protein_length=155 / sequence_SO=supercontig / SO=protein_coding / is_pseudo=false